MENSKQPFIGSIDKVVFDEDCRHYFAIHPDIPEGVNGGELEKQGGERPTRMENLSAGVGKNWRDLIRNDTARQGLERPRSNWYRENNRLHQDLN